MALTSTPVAQDLLSVLAELAARDHPNFGPWCRPADAEAVRRTIIDRSDDLRKLIDQAVRLIRLAALASIADYTQFLYLDVPVLRARLFKSAVETARRQGRLANSLVDVGTEGIRLREATMALHAHVVDRGYELGYGQMVRPAIMLDVLHNTLGYHVVAEVAAGAMVRGPTKVTARDIANDLRSRFNAWLAPRLESAHRRHQAKVLHAFLAARDALLPERIDDEAVLAFWEARAQSWHDQLRLAGNEAMASATVERAARDEGFRVFRSAVTAVLRYRQALVDAADAHALENAGQTQDMRPDLSLDYDGDSIQPVSAPPWISPLSVLERQPASRIKWLNNKEFSWLANFLGGNGTADRDLPDEVEEAAEMTGKGGLMDGRRYDRGFLRTLLRVDAFGPVQSVLIAGLKRRQAVSDAVAQALLAMEHVSFADAEHRYVAIREQLDTEALAALNVLASSGDLAAVLLIEFLAGTEALSEVKSLALEIDLRVLPFRPRRQNEYSAADGCADRSTEAPELARIGLVLQKLFQESLPSKALADLVGRSKAARRQVARSGFKPSDTASVETVAALVHSIPAVIDLMRELDQLLGRLGTHVDSDELAKDRRRFADVIRLIYAPHS